MSPVSHDRIGAPSRPLRSRAMPPVPRRDWIPPSRRRVRALRDRLRLVYGRPIAPPHRQPLEELILTVLSQSTSDRNRDVAYLRLVARFPDWAAVRDAPERRGRGGDPARRDLQGQVGADPGDPARAAGPALARPPRGHDGRGGARRALRAAGRRPQDRGVRAALRLRDARHPGRHARLARRHAARPVPAGRAVRGAARRDARPDAARRRSTSSTSTCCATAGGRATRSGRGARSATCGGCARMRRRRARSRR